MKAWAFFACCVIGVVLTIGGYAYGRAGKQPPSGIPTPPQALAEQESRQEIGQMVKWTGAGLFIVGAVGLIFCGVRRSAMMNRPGY